MKISRYYLLVIFLSSLPIFGIFTTSLLPHTHDGLVHLARIAAYFKALQDFQIPVRWAGDLNYGYGMPLFNFIYQLPYFIASLFIALGAGLAFSFKATLYLSFILAGVFMFGFAETLFGDSRKAFMIAIFYQFSPFRIVEVLIRGSFGEVYTYAFFPLVLWGLLLLFKKHAFKYLVLVAISTALLIISHNAISLVFFIIAFCFIIVFGEKIKNYILGFLSLILGLILTAFYWIPAILEHKFTYGDLFMRNVYLSHFPPLQNFFIPNLFNNIKFQTGGVASQFGIFHVITLALAIFLLFFNKKIESNIKKIIIFCIVIILIALFFMQPISSPLWKNVSLLRQFQFPWRFLSIVSFATALMSISFFYFNLFKKKLIYILTIFLVILSTAYYWKPQLGVDKINEKYYWNFPLTTTYFGETDLIWSEGPAKQYPAQRIEIIDGKGSIGQITKKSNLLTFPVDAQIPIKVIAHIQYFPGWRAFIDGKQVPVQFQYQIYRGEIVFSIPQGEHNIKLSFGESPIRFTADALTVASFISLLLFGVFKRFSK